MSQSQQGNPVTRDRFDAVLFDLDGVLTSTAKIHAACWKEMFDEYRRRRHRPRRNAALKEVRTNDSS